MKPTLACAVLLAAGQAVPSGHALAQGASYPNRPVRIIVGFPAGGGVDMGARLVGQALGDVWGSTVVIDNRPGASGTIGAELTAKSTPDGYTLMLCQIASHAINPARHKKLPYDHLRDLVAIGQVGLTPNLIVAHASVGVKSLGDLLARARAEPGRINFGTSGVGGSPHMSMELLMLMAGVRMTHVPYKGASLALADVMGGQMQVMAGNLPGGPLGAVKSGKVVGLAVTTAKRSARLPELATVAEQGVPGYDVSSWYGICGPSGMPKPLVTRINADLVKALARPDVQAKIADQGIDVQSSTPEQFLAFIKVETAKWAKVVRDGNLGAD